jgi:hypothetical protein
MKPKIIMASLLAVGLSGLAAYACPVQVRIACANDATSSGIWVVVDNAFYAQTDSLGIAQLSLSFGTHNVCVIKDSLPAGASLTPLCQKITIVDYAPPVVVFTLGGTFCSAPPPQGPCWLTGGGTIGKTQGVANYSFGGVVYPGCSPNAADGGNWNVVNHFNGMHFQGQEIIVDSCSGVSTQSPKVDVNIIDFHGLGIVEGLGTVTFVGRAIDNHESGGGSDMLYLSVSNGGATPLLQIGNSKDDPAIIATGNLQIHTSSCGN